MKVTRIADAADHISPEAVRQSATQVVPTGTVLMVTRSGILAHTFPVAVTTRPVALNQDLKALVPNPGVDPEYIYWALEAHQRRILASCSKAGTTVASIDTSRLLAFQIPVPSLDEQRAIVAAIEQRTTWLDVAVAQVQTAGRRARRYRSAIQYLAVTGRLVDDAPEGARELPKGWRLARIADLATVSSGSTPRAGDSRYYEGGDVPWVTSGDLNSGVVRTARQFVTRKAVGDYRLKLHQPGTLLVAMYGEGKTRGKCAELAIPATTNQACAAIKINDESIVLGAWLRLFFDASYEANRRLASGGVQPNLSGQLIKAMSVPLPPIPEQQSILAELDRRMTVIGSVLGACEAAAEKAGALRQTILGAAFSGRLVDAMGTAPGAEQGNPVAHLHGALA